MLGAQIRPFHAMQCRRDVVSISAEYGWMKYRIDLAYNVIATGGKCPELLDKHTPFTEDTYYTKVM